MKKYNKYGANYKNPQTAPWEKGMIVKPEVRDYLKQLFKQDASKGLKPYYYWHYNEQQVMCIDYDMELNSQEKAFKMNDIELVETRVLTNQEWCGYDKVYMRIYRSRSGEKISNGIDPLAFSFDYMVGSTELIYFSFHK
jgi:hypothetical protein